jgi:hypothetical protein
MSRGIPEAALPVALDVAPVTADVPVVVAANVSVDVVFKCFPQLESFPPTHHVSKCLDVS